MPDYREVDGRKIPPLNFKQLKEYVDVLTAFSNITDPLVAMKEMPTIIPVVHAAMRRSDPSITMEQVEEFVDMGNFRRVFEAVMGVDSKDVAAGGSAPATVATAS